MNKIFDIYIKYNVKWSIQSVLYVEVIVHHVYGQSECKIIIILKTQMTRTHHVKDFCCHCTEIQCIVKFNPNILSDKPVIYV